MITKKYLNDLTYNIIGAAIEVHKALGPGLLESVYHKCMKHELLLRRLSFASEFVIPIHYKGVNIDADLRCDMLVENQIVVEFKAVNDLDPVYEAQLLTYMKLMQKPKGILINFNSSNLFKHGQQTYVNEYFRELPEF